MKFRLLILTLLMACLALPAPAEELKIQKAYSGYANLPMKQPGEYPRMVPPQVLRSQKELARFVATIPSREISMTNPSPPSKDPLLQKPAIDFSRCMAVVVFTDYIYNKPTVESVTHDGDAIVVKVRRDEMPQGRMMQYPLGVGCYQLVLVPKAAGKGVEGQDLHN